MKIQHLKVKLKNLMDDKEFKNPFVKMIHPLTRSAPGKNNNILLVPSWVDGIINKVEAKKAFLELIR